MIAYFKWLFNFKCDHQNWRKTYGDENNMVGAKRYRCLDCPRGFEEAPNGGT